MRRLLSSLALLTALLAAPALAPSAAQAGTVTPGNAALNWAEAHALGCWYHYGGTSCSPGYDCSGLVSTSVLRATGIWIGRDTYTMLATNGEGHFERIPLSQARRGDILFYGTGHVEIDTAWSRQSFGALETGTRVGWHTWNAYWHPTSAYRVH
jgi:cell wall-associated NlpC family hydrolase